MARDIEEFLRRAAERRQQQQQKNQRGPAPSERVREIVETDDIEIVQPVEVKKPLRKRQSGGQLKRKKQTQQRDLRHESVAEHVRSHINTSDIAEHAEHLGDRIQNADDRIEARLQKKFDHDVSKLDDLPTVQDDVVATVTEIDVSHISKSLISMLRNPISVRQAILISEILKRPDFD